HMDTNLMSSPCFQFTCNQRHITKSLKHFVMSYGFFSLTLIFKNDILESVFRASAYVSGNCSFIVSYITPYQSYIFTLTGFIEKLFSEFDHSLLGFSND